MKEETDGHQITGQPSETEMNDMHKNAWLDFQAEAQGAKKEVDRRYAIMMESFGSYKQMPYGVKEIIKADYEAYKTKWGENGEEQQKRFGVKEPNPAIKVKEEPEPAKQELPEDQSKKREEFLQNLQQQRERQKMQDLEYTI